MAKKTNYVDTLKQYRKANTPLLIFGGPGIGKSEICKQVVEGDDDRVIDVRLSMLEPVDMRGLPLVNKGKAGDNPTVTWAIPDFLPTSGKGIILFDEINTADPSVQNAALQFILDRRCGPHKLGDGWWIVACGNKAKHKAHVNPLSAPLRNRFVIMEMEANFDQWRTWALRNNVHEHVLGYLSWQQGSGLYADPVDEYSNFPTPRSWTRVSTLLKADVTDDLAIQGCVGVAAGVLFKEYMNQVANIPNMDDLLEGKGDFKDAGGNNLSLVYAVTMNLLSRSIKKPEIIDKAAAVFTRCGIRAECAAIYYAGVMLQPDAKYLMAVAKSPAARAWMSQHKNMLMKFEVKEKLPDVKVPAASP